MRKRTILLVIAGMFSAVAGSPASAARTAGDAPPLTTKVFTTREGLVGGYTANGYRIKDRDWFAALPSRRGLSPKGSGERSVKACTDKRCVYVPIWDVGPWNTKDDYWNSSRQMWSDLPTGKPQAQAAYLDGYNGGRDEFGRRAANPAGLDLGDGAFWDGLGMVDNGWVKVTFLWTGGGHRAEVDTDGDPLRVRASASTGVEVRGGAGNHAQVPVECQIKGEKVTGSVRTTNLWDRLASGQYVSHAYIKVPGGWKVPSC